MDEETVVLATQVSLVALGAVLVVQIGLIYEWVALRYRSVPTITAMVMKTPKLARAAIVATPLAWAVYHFDIV